MLDQYESKITLLYGIDSPNRLLTYLYSSRGASVILMGVVTVEIDRYPWDSDESKKLCKWLLDHRELREIKFNVIPVGAGNPFRVQVRCNSVQELVPIVKLIGWYEARLGLSFEEV